jgi:phage N-6-adenine-methyltransferase
MRALQKRGISKRLGRPRKYKTNADRQRAYRKRLKLPVYHRHASDLWGTPQAEFDTLHADFGFTLDACAIAANAKCDHYFTPEQDGLLQEWAGVVWCNPPYSQVARWIAKASAAAQQGATVVYIVYACVDTVWWHTYVARYAEVRFPKGRWKFERPGGRGNSAPRPTAIVIFRPPCDVI